MKFGGNLHKNQVPHWAPFYINYNRLKQLYKLASMHTHEHGEDADFTGLQRDRSSVA